MARFTAFSPDHETLGQILIGYKQAIGAEEFRSYFEKRGLGGIDPQKWYPIQDFLDVLNDMVEVNPGRMMDFVSIGMRLAEKAIMPPGFETLPLLNILQMSSEGMKLNSRGTDLGEMRAELVAERHIKATARFATPDDMTYGMLYGFARRFLPKGTHFTVSYDDQAPRRDHGGETTTINIKWG